MLFVINFKTYVQTLGKRGDSLGRIIDKINSSSQHSFIICPQEADLSCVASKVKVRVFAQHLDGLDGGKHTGFTIPAEAKAIGIKGTLLNHAEHKIPNKEIKKTIELCKKYKLKTIVCVEDIKRLRQVMKYSPWAIAYEPPSLIGGDVSVSKSKPEIISKAVSILKGTKIKLLVGAGVKTKQDVSVAKKLGAKGVLIASGVVKARNPRKKILELVG